MSAPVLDRADRARRRAETAGREGVYALDRVEAWTDAGGRLRMHLHFRPGPGPDGGVPAGIDRARVRLRGPEGAVPVLSAGPRADGWVPAVAAPAGGARDGVYVLSLEDVPGVDPLLASAEFTLGLSSPPAEERAPVDGGAAPPPSIDYLVKDYATFRQAMLDRMAVTLPTWTERNPSDVGVMLVEVLAYAADGLSYYQDAAATEAYLGTARLRTSLSRHARLLDYPVNQGCSATAWVQVRVAQRGIVLPRGTRMYTRTSQPATVLVPGTAAHAGALREQPLAFETLEPLHADPGLNEMPLYTWGAPSYALARGATSATLADAWQGGGRALAALRAGEVIVLQEQIGDGGGAPEPAHRQAVRLTRVEPRVIPSATGGAGTPVVDVAWHDDDALQFRLVVSGTAGGAPYTGGGVALGNLVPADHGRTVDALSDLPPVPPRGPYRPYVPLARVSRRPPYHPRLARSRSAAAAMAPAPGAAVGEVWLRDDEGRAWTARADLLRSTPFSRDFVVEPGEEGTSRLRFGDGSLGMAPVPGTRFRLWCREGLGLAGNVGRDVLAHLAPPAGDAVAAQQWTAGVLQVRNPLPAWGGAMPETPQEVRARAPRAYQQQARGATPADWVALAQAQPGVRRAGAESGWEGAGPQDRVWVQREQGFPEDGAFLGGVRRRLEPYRPAGRALRVLGPAYVGVDVGLRVRLEEHALRSATERALRTALGNGPQGVFSPAAFTFGESAWLSQVVAAAAGVPGVTWVQPLRFARWDPYGTPATVADELAMGPHEIVRMGGDRSAPWNGTLALELVGGVG